jgi:hypothetical protein
MKLLTMAVGLCLGFATVCWGAEPPYEIQWTQQLATSFGHAVTVDGDGNALMCGAGDDAFGAFDAFVAKFDGQGETKWARQFGSSGLDYATSVAVDHAGGIYMSGNTDGSLAGPQLGNGDSFLAKYDATGNIVWSRQFGTTLWDESGAVAVDPVGNVYMCGHTHGSLGAPKIGLYDVFLTKHDAAGNSLWIRQFGTAGHDLGLALATDSTGHVYVGGSTYGNLGGPNAGNSDAFFAKLDSAGETLWTRQFGTAQSDAIQSMAIDATGNLYVSGWTGGALAGPSAGGNDTFLSKYNSDGTLLWTQQMGTPSSDMSRSVAVDTMGNAYVTGHTQGALGGPNAGGSDVFLSKYDTTGELQWVMQFGSSDSNDGYSVAVDAAGNVYIAGFTIGTSGGPNAGNLDAFLVKLSPVPEPGSIALCILFALIGAVVWRRRA